MPTNTGIGAIPPEFALQQQQLNRQQQMAQLLLQQGQQMAQGPAGQMVSGRYVPNSFFQNLQPAANMLVGAYLAKKGDKVALDLAEALRKNRMQEAEAIMGAQTPDEQLKLAMGGYSPLSQQLAGKLLERKFEKPKWEKASIPTPDGGSREGWVNVNSPNPLTTFVEGGTKPAFNTLEAMRFQYDTGMRLPSGGAVNMPAGTAAPAGSTMPTDMPTGGAVPSAPAVQTGAPMVSAAGMSPRDLSEANKQVFADVQKRRMENLEKTPMVIATIEDTLRNVNDLIGDARVIKDPKTGKEKIDYTVTVDGKQVQGRKPQSGFEYAVGAGLPSWMVMGGSDTAGFLGRLEQIKGKTFLQAFESLKGAGQITEKEGEKATSALNRMNTAQSEVEFIKAAREFEENLNRGMELAKKKVGMPSGSSAALRWNPTTKRWE
jgi:hypothetical protein